jgi:hypothetical protein
MESSFKDLIVTSLTMKTVRKSDKRFDLQNILNFQIFVFNMMTSTLLSFSILVLIKRLDYMHGFVLGAHAYIPRDANLLVEKVYPTSTFV